MTEARLQYECVKWFNNTHKDYRGCLVEINNNTNKGAHRKSLGQVAGASDLVFFDKENGNVLLIELKLNGSCHNVEHLRRQYSWLRMMNCSFFSLFVFDLEMFQDVINFCINEDYEKLNTLCAASAEFMHKRLLEADTKGFKSITLKYA